MTQFTWKTKFKSMIIVDNEIFQNEYNVKIAIKTNVADLKEQSSYFERIKSLFEYVFSNTVTGCRDDASGCGGSHPQSCAESTDPANQT